ncbi:MAG: hypothetical protein ACREF0_12455, partial [Acetobacteraceae bacterium]
LAGGLALALAVGAVASSRQPNDAALAKQSLAGSEARLALRPDRAVMRVFARSATPGDAVPASIRDTLAQFAGAPVDPAINPGTSILSGARRAIADAGIAHASLYLVPTDKGSLCMLWAPDVYGGGCTAGFAPGAHAVYLRGFSNGQTWVWGILRNDVTSVDAVVNGQAVPVTLAPSAFFYQGSALPSSLQMTLTDGSVTTLSVSAVPSIK